MTWSYFPNLLGKQAKDTVRLLIGDVLSSDPQLQDEEINYFVTNRGTLYGAAADACRAMASKFSRSVDQQSGQSKFSFSQMAKAYNTKAAQFEEKAGILTAVVYAGGISASDVLLQEVNSDRMQPQFTVGMDDNYLPEPAGANETLETFAGNGTPNP
jgi:hypothetical protein